MTNINNIYYNNDKIGLLFKNAFLLKQINLHSFENIEKNQVSIEGSNSYVYSTVILDLDDESDIDKIINNTQLIVNSSYKSLIILPRLVTKNIKEKIIFLQEILSQKPSLVGYVYVDPTVNEGELFAFNKNITSKTHPIINVTWLIEEVFSLIFSMKGYGSSTGLLGTSENYEYLKSFTILEADQIKKYPFRITLKNNGSKIENNDDSTIQKQLAVLPKESNLDFKLPVKNNLESANTHKKSLKRFKHVKILLFVIVSVVLLGLMPLILYLSGLLLLKTSALRYVSEKPIVSSVLQSSSGFVFKASNASSAYFTSVPLLKIAYSELSVKSKKFMYYSNIQKESSEIKAEVLNTINTFLESGLSEKWQKLSDLSASLKMLRSDLSFAKAEVDASENANRQENLHIDINSFEGVLESANKLSMDLPKALAINETKRYVVVSDNNNSRGSGGEITDLVIIELSNGKIISVNNYGEKTLNSGIQGQVEAPGEYALYFPNKNWNLGESHWYTDYSKSAEQIIWFVDKILNIQIDGVVSISEKSISNINNKYSSDKSFSFELVDHEEEGENRELINFITSILSKNNYKNWSLTDDIYELFKSRDLRIYFKDTNINQSLNEFRSEILGESGDCINDCYKDVVGELFLSEDPEVINNISKEVSLSISIEEGLVKKRLTYFIKHTKDSDQDVVIGTFSSNKSGFSPVTIVSDVSREDVDGKVVIEDNLKKIYSPLNLKADQTIGISFYWEEPFDNNIEKYVLNYKKLLNTPNYVFSLKIKLPTGYKIIDGNGLNLTEDGELIYNTSLSKDLLLKIIWQKTN